MSHEYLHISTDNGKTWRDLKDTASTEEYIKKLSFAAIVRVKYDTGEWHEIECGKIINRGGMYQSAASGPTATHQELTTAQLKADRIAKRPEVIPAQPQRGSLGSGPSGRTATRTECAQVSRRKP